MSSTLVHEDRLTRSLGADILAMHLIPTLSYEELSALSQTCTSLYSATKYNDATYHKRYQHLFSSDVFSATGDTWRSQCRSRKCAVPYMVDMTSGKEDCVPVEMIFEECVKDTSPIKDIVVLDDHALALLLNGQLCLIDLRINVPYRNVMIPMEANIKRIWKCSETKVMVLDADNMIYEIEAPCFKPKKFYRWPYVQQIDNICSVKNKIVAVAKGLGIIGFSEDFAYNTKATGHWVIYGDPVIEATSTRNGLVLLNDKRKAFIIEFINGDFESPMTYDLFNNACPENDHFINISSNPLSPYLVGITEKGKLIVTNQLDGSNSIKIDGMNPLKVFWSENTGLVMNNDGYLYTWRRDFANDIWIQCNESHFKQINMPCDISPVNIAFGANRCMLLTVNNSQV